MAIQISRIGHSKNNFINNKLGVFLGCRIRPEKSPRLPPNPLYCRSMDGFSLAQQIAIWTLPVLFAITVHEVAHGWMAGKLGDPTARMLGRLTLNPIKHIDPIGTVAVPLALLLLTGGSMVFGWARPVPVTYENLRHPRRDMALVAVAGPLANLLMAVLWGLVAKLGLILAATEPMLGLPLLYMGAAGILFNLLLMLFNLLPIPPLDGGRMLTGILPPKLGWKLSQIEPYGLIVLVGLLATGLLPRVIGPLLQGLNQGIFRLLGL